MKRIYLFMFCLMIFLSAEAKLAVSTLADGTVVLTVSAAGDIDAEFTGWDTAAKLKSGSVLAGVTTTAKSIKVVTVGNALLSSGDVSRLCGENSGNFQHFTKVATLDLSEANVGDQSYLRQFGFLTSLRKITFPKSTTSIPDYTFLESSKSKIEEVIIPDNASICLTLGSQAFHTSSLRKITIGARETIQVGSLCFQGDTNLTTVDFRYGSTSIVIGEQAFTGTTALANIVLPEGVTEIGPGAFLNSGVQSIRLPNTLKYIRTKAFAGCSSLKSITIPESVEQIETATFENNYNLSDVYVMGTKTKCAEGAFTDNVAYQYHLKNYTDGQTLGSLSDYTIESGMQTRTVLHVVSAAYKCYVNDYIQVLGTDKYRCSPYGSHPELNHWIYDTKGNKLPVVHSDYFENTKGDYAGWKNFMLVDGCLESNVYTDDMRVRDKWYTLCLPFDMTSEQLKSAYGAAVEVVEFSGVQITTEPTGGKTILLQFKAPVSSTKAHHPYMIHPSVHSGTRTGVRVSIVGIDKQPETQENLNAQKVVITASDGVEYTFIGNYTTDRGLQQYSYYYYSLDDESQWPNGFYKWVAAAGGTWTPYTSCVLMNRDNGANAKPAMDLGIDSTETTAVVAVVADQGLSERRFSGVMNINGQLVRRDATNLDGLPRGIYIINGKKHIIH